MWIFIGEVATPRLVFPCAVPIKTKKKIELSESRKMASLLINSLKPVKTVSDGFLLYHNLYSVIPTSNGHISVQEIISKSVNTTLCDMINRVGFYTLTYVEDNKESIVKVIPIIVIYKDGLWEHVSVAPVKAVENSEYKVNDEYGLGIVVTGTESEHIRPYAYNIIHKPTSLIMLRKCRITE
ncbi:MAG: hypothetical protein QXK24_00795 [Ignisphaera sp.]|uniref:Uncharacterized protein n=1 Tax=Ignisphaera aggregans TaxID=334771 RepID=A0A7C4H2Q1_9CREN